MDDYKNYYKGVWFHFNMEQGISTMHKDQYGRDVIDPYKNIILPQTKFTIHREEAEPGMPRYTGNYIASAATKASHYLFGTRIIQTGEFVYLRWPILTGIMRFATGKKRRRNEERG